MNTRLGYAITSYIAYAKHRGCNITKKPFSYAAWKFPSFHERQFIKARLLSPSLVFSWFLLPFPSVYIIFLNSHLLLLQFLSHPVLPKDRNNVPANGQCLVRIGH